MTFLPMLRRNRFLLQTLLSSVDVVILSLDAPGDEVDAWKAAFSAKPTLLSATIPPHEPTSSCLVDALLQVLTVP